MDKTIAVGKIININIGIIENKNKKLQIFKEKLGNISNNYLCPIS